MIKTIKDLLEHYNISTDDVEDYVLSFEFDEGDWAEEFGEYPTEEHDGNIVHVWTSKGTDPENGEEIIGERILDLNGHASMTSIISLEDGTRTSTTIGIGKDTIIMGNSYTG